MLDLINVFESEHKGSSGEALFESIINCLRVHGIPMENFIGFAADGAANIMGKNNSLSTRLKDFLPGINIFKCVAHSIHLCSSETAKTFPRSCEDLVRNIYNFFSHSAKKKTSSSNFKYFVI